MSPIKILGAPSGAKPPGKPTIGTVTVSSTTATVPFTAPTFLGVPAGTTYIARAYDSAGVLISPPKTGTATSSPVSVTGLSYSTQYKFTVELTNIAGTTISDFSNTITTPAPPPFFPFFPGFGPFFPFFPGFAPFFPFFPFFPSFVGPVSPPFLCIQGDTLVKTIDGYVKAREIKIGDKLASYTYKELPINEKDYDITTWTSKSLTEGSVVETEVKAIKSGIRTVTVVFNGNKEKRFSLEHTMFIKRDGVYMFAQSGTLDLGDILLYDNNGVTTEIPIDSINYIDEETDVYDILVDPYDLLIAGDLIVHNIKGPGF